MHPKQAIPGPLISDRELVVRAQQGDKEAMDILFQRHRSHIYTIAFNIIKNKADAEDVVQEVGLVIFRFIKGFKHNSAFTTWLYRVTVSRVSMILRKIRSQTRLEISSLGPLEADLRPGPYTTPETISINTELREAIIDGLTHMSSPLRKTLILRDLEGYTIKEAAKKLGLAESTVKAGLWRARKALRQSLRLRQMAQRRPVGSMA